MKAHPYPCFRDALLRLALTNNARAERLGVTPEAISRYLNGHGLPLGSILVLAPDLIAGLLEDAVRIEEAQRDR